MKRSSVRIRSSLLTKIAKWSQLHLAIFLYEEQGKKGQRKEGLGLFLLIDADIVDFVTHREGIGLRFTSVDSTNGKVKKDVLGLVERIGMVANGTVDGVEGGDIVE